jgi:hypothetical protein
MRLPSTSGRRVSLPLVLSAAIFATLMLAIGALALAPPPSLPGSNFEIDTNANLVVNNPGSDDWASIAQPPEIRTNDLPTGRDDNSYAGGSKEDDTCPGTTTGSIPNNKSDLKTFGAYVEPEAGGPGFLNLFWTRVQEPSGTTLMDFELNKSSTDCGNGINPVRTTGDLLIEYRIEQGGAVASIKVRTWTGSAWGPADDLTAAAQAAGTINTTPITAGNADGLGALSARTFGEAQLDLDFIFQSGECESFGSAFLKSRSSDSFTSQLKDVIAPVPVQISNCGNVIIHKVTEPSPDPTDTTFNYTTTGGLDPSTFPLKNGETQDYGSLVTAGQYTVTESDPGPDFALTDLDCTASETNNGTTVTPSLGTGTVSFDLKANDTVECTYTNTLQQGALAIEKDSTKGGAVSNAGAVFSYDGAQVEDNGTDDEDPAIGRVCVSGLATGDYTVNEVSPPPGYGGADEVDQTVTVVSGTNCSDNLPGADATATFTNPPLADIQVNFRDGGSGETSATSLSCTNTGTTADTTPASGWEDSVTHTDIEIDPSPRTVTCEIVIDP